MRTAGFAGCFRLRLGPLLGLAPKTAAVVGRRTTLPGMDVEKFLRLRGAIQGALDGMPPDTAAISGAALASAYYKLRKEAYSLASDEDRAEFEGLFPERVQAPAGGGMRSEGVMYATA